LELKFSVTGSADDRAVRDFVLNNIGPLYEGLAVASIDIEPEHVDTVTNVGRWSVTVQYDNSSLGEPDETFETVGGTFHLTQSRETVFAIAVEGTPKNYKGAIGVDDKQVEGVDIPVPIYNFGETYILGRAFVNAGYKHRLFSLTGTINDDFFRGFEPGEVLFKGATGTRHNPTLIRVDYKFSASPNLTNIPVGDMVVTQKRGWDYMWVRYEDRDDTVAHGMVLIPTAVYVERVFNDGNFAQLGIGTGITPQII